LSGIPDWLIINPEDLDRALESLPIPKGPIPTGISLQEAIEVKQWHNIHIRQHQLETIILHIYRYTIMGASQCGNDRPGFVLLSVSQKLRACNIIRVLNIIKLKF
jgi:hypothetical protein